jgi:hypothetical protein
MRRALSIAGKSAVVALAVTGILLGMLAQVTGAHGRYELACYATHGHYPVSCHSSIPHKLACVDVIRDAYVTMRHCSIQ